MKAAQRAGTLRKGVAVTDADVVTGYASQRLLWIGIVTDTECKPLTFGLFDNVACLNDSDTDMDTDTCTDSLPQFIWCWLKVKLGQIGVGSNNIQNHLCMAPRKSYLVII